MRRRHEMPFGASPVDGGGARFRLWAPAAKTVELCLGDETLAMDRAGDGWFETTRPARAGARYRYRIDRDLLVPDPASRFNPDDVHAPSELVDPLAYEWRDGAWRGRPWEEAVIYELHVGTFSPEGTYAGVERRLDALAGLGVTAVELMPLADFPGARGWGYDGVLPYAPDSAYGRPEDLKRLVDGAHARGLMMFLDVVYNHFGPDGNYLHAYARQFFTERYATPWGAAIDFEDERPVREFFVQNALYWLEEYRFDGLRFDAVHAIHDASRPDIVEEIADRVRSGPGREREIHLVLENDANRARYLARGPDGRPRRYTAQWNDDAHHAFHVLLTGESDGYYSDYADKPAARLARCLAQGFAYQGEPSAFRDGETRGEPSAHLPPTAFVSFIQNHDQVGNRALGERISRLASEAALEVAMTVLLLAPSPPMLFMGDEFAAATPFLFFCDFSGDLARAVTEGRRREFAGFEKFRDPAAADPIPDPGDPGTFERSKLDWASLSREPHASFLATVRRLLELRRREIVPLVSGIRGGSASTLEIGARAIEVRWPSGAAELVLLANLGDAPEPLREPPAGRLIHATHADARGTRLPAWSASWWLR
ncbi:MAG TPA: malto-oligosyltrehalose trehalohydrolase [Burkholderiales bacterium]|nr:malto-oligosyltrehalose trehalohydrolase [Burkholderiales bacterium]